MTAIYREFDARRAVMRQQNEAFGGAAIQQQPAASAAIPALQLPAQAQAQAAPLPPDPSIARARAAGVDTKVFGLELGERLSLQPCGLDNLLSTRTCVSDDILGIAAALLGAAGLARPETATIHLATASCPAWTWDCTATAVLEQGRLIGVDIATAGPNVAAAVQRELSGKYGRPTSTVNHTVTPRNGGAEFDVRVAAWALTGLHVEFQPVVELNEDGAVRINEGLVRIETERARERRDAAEKEAARPRL